MKGVLQAVCAIYGKSISVSWLDDKKKIFLLIICTVTLDLCI